MELSAEKLESMRKWVNELKERDRALAPSHVQSIAKDMEALIEEVTLLREKVAERDGVLVQDGGAIRIQRERAEQAEVALQAAEDALDEDGAESQEGTSIADRIAALSEDRQTEKVRAERAEERVSEVEADLAAQKELNATTAAQLAEAIMERSTILDAKAVTELVKSKSTVKLRSLDRLTVDGLLTLVKLTGSGGRVSGVTKPEGWPFILCAAVGSPGNQPAVELLQDFDAKLGALGAPLIANADSGYVPNYQQLLHALEPFRKVAEVYALYNPPLSARGCVRGRAPMVYQLGHPSSNEQGHREAGLTAQDFETLHMVLTGKVPEGW